MVIPSGFSVFANDLDFNSTNLDYENVELEDIQSFVEDGMSFMAMNQEETDEILVM